MRVVRVWGPVVIAFLGLAVGLASILSVCTPDMTEYNKNILKIMDFVFDCKECVGNDTNLRDLAEDARGKLPFQPQGALKLMLSNKRTPPAVAPLASTVRLLSARKISTYLSGKPRITRLGHPQVCTWGYEWWQILGVVLPAVAAFGAFAHDYVILH